MNRIDLLVIGGGAAGIAASEAAAALGARVALVEERRPGGQALWSGAVPGQALAACARTAWEMREGARFGIRAPAPTIDFARVMRWVRGAQRRAAPHEGPERLRAAGIDVIRGSARFAGERVVTVEGQAIGARRVIIATGSRPTLPPIEGLRNIPVLTSETIFALERLPARLLVLGGGRVGVELAQSFVRLGAGVTLVEASAQLLPDEDFELASLLASRLAAEGVQLLLGTAVVRASTSGGMIRLVGTRHDGTTAIVEGDALLAAVGRRPNVDALEPEAAGVAYDARRVLVDRRLRTTARGVWAAGDVTGAPRFVSVARRQAQLAVRDALLHRRGDAGRAIVPWGVFTDPPLARVGLTEAEARALIGDGVRVWRAPYDVADRALADGQAMGMVKLVTDARGRLLGGHILGRGAGEMIGELALAMQEGVPATRLASLAHAYPTFAGALEGALRLAARSRASGLTGRLTRWLVRR